MLILCMKCCGLLVFCGDGVFGMVIVCMVGVLVKVNGDIVLMLYVLLSMVVVSCMIVCVGCICCFI